MTKILKKNLPFFILLLLAFLTRFSFLSYPAEVVFDEVHFGKFVSAYFTSQYYFDIHPPLGKLMIAGFAKIFGFQSNFDFAQIGEVFDNRSLFILRFLPALFGALFVILIWKFILALGLSKKAAFLGGFLVLFDNALLTQSKFILVDIFLIFFGFTALYFFILAKKSEGFIKKQILLYTLSALFAGLAFSIKWTGLSFLGIILFFTFLDFLKNLKIQEFFPKIVIFILLPFFIYLLIFAVHFNLLKNSGPGNNFMSPAFQKSLQENTVGPEVKPLNFLGKFLELNKVMYISSAKLSTGHPDASFWHQWPLGKKPIWYWTKNLDGKVANIYLLGNPLVWWSTTLSFLLILFGLFFKKLRKKLSSFMYILIFGFFINLLPFILIGRVTFLYHYLPSLTFGILIFAILADRILETPFQKKVKLYKLKKMLEKGKLESRPEFLGFNSFSYFFLYSGFLLAIFLVFLFLSPLSYGFAVSAKINQIYNILIKFLN